MHHDNHLYQPMCVQPSTCKNRQKFNLLFIRLKLWPLNLMVKMYVLLVKFRNQREFFDPLPLVVGIDLNTVPFQIQEQLCHFIDTFSIRPCYPSYRYRPYNHPFEFSIIIEEQSHLPYSFYFPYPSID